MFKSSLKPWLAGAALLSVLASCSSSVQKASSAAAIVASGYSVDVLATDSWPGGFNGAVRIKNVSGAATINNFEVKFTSGAIIKSSWNGAIASASGTHTATSPSWITPIKTGQQWDVGFNATGSLGTTTISSLKVNGTSVSLTSTPTPADTTAPTVSVTSSSSSVTAAGSITLTASASDNVGVSKVEFYDGTTLINSDSSAPYTASVAFTSANNGSKAYTAKAYDAAGNATTSTAANVTVNIAAPSTTDTTAPTVSVASSASNVTAAGSITLTATASDNVGVSKVEFYDGATLLSSDDTSPYTASVALTSANNGSKSYTAKAYDAAGNNATSAAAGVTVNIATTTTDTQVGTGGFAVTTGGNVAGAKSFTAKTYTEINTILANALLDANGKKVTGGAYPVIITYTGNEDTAIAQIIKDSTPDSTGKCPAPHWSDAYREVPIKDFTKGITIIGADGSSGNFGITIIKSSNVVVQNMKLGALGGASSDADLLRVDSSSHVWIDHNELFSSNHECAGSPDGDLTFEGALDIKKDAHNITVSYNYIHDHKKVGLDGSSSTDIAGGRELTFHHNMYNNVNARLPLQRGGWTHMYNNLYSNITASGINVRQAGYALIESNYFEKSKNPVVCISDTSNCGFWELRNNNITSPADFSKYGITWGTLGTGEKNAAAWTNTAAFPKALKANTTNIADSLYFYSPVSAQCVKDQLANFAGVGKGLAQLTAAACK